VPDDRELDDATEWSMRSSATIAGGGSLKAFVNLPSGRYTRDANANTFRR
jgi:hypothetical protein